jgi:hypothetical protein
MTTELDVPAISGFGGDVTDCRRDVTESTAGRRRYPRRELVWSSR